MLWKVSQKFDTEEETAKPPFVIGNDARQEAKCSLRKLNLQGAFIIIYDSGSQQKQMKYSSEIKLPSPTSKNSKHSKKASKDANQTKRTTPLETSELTRLDDSIWESFPSGYTSFTPFRDKVTKAGLSTAVFSHRYTTQVSTEITLRCQLF